MPEIVRGGQYATFINTFRCDPHDQGQSRSDQCRHRRSGRSELGDSVVALDATAGRAVAHRVLAGGRCRKGPET